MHLFIVSHKVEEPAFFIGAGARISVRSEPEPDLEQSRSRGLNEKVPA